MTQETGPPPTTSTSSPPRLRRSNTDKMVAGVCGGLGQYFNTDPLWFRIGFVIFTLAGGAGILVYLIAAIVIPKAEPGEDVGTREGGLDAEAPVILGVALVGIGLMLLINNMVPWFDKVMWPLAVVIAGAGLIYLGMRREHS
jgi:phage shock protein C